MSEGYFDPDQFPEYTLILSSLNQTFLPKKVACPDSKTVVFGRLPQDVADLPTVPKFQSKVVSRQHCSIYCNTGKFYVKDMGSSSGTFLQNQKFGDKPYRLSEQGKESSLFELHDGDMIQLGEDYDQGGVFHKCIMIRVNFPSIAAPYSASPRDASDPNDSYEGNNSFIDYATDPDVRRDVEDEFNALWASLISPLTSFTPRASSFNRKISNERRESENYGTYGRSPAQQISTPPPAAAQLPPQTGDVTPNECINFIQTLQWDSPYIQSRLIELIQSGDSHILGFYRSLKQFPSAFKDVVTKYVQKKNAA